MFAKKAWVQQYDHSQREAIPSPFATLISFRNATVPISIVVQTQKLHMKFAGKHLNTIQHKYTHTYKQNHEIPYRFVMALEMVSAGQTPLPLPDISSPSNNFANRSFIILISTQSKQYPPFYLNSSNHKFRSHCSTITHSKPTLYNACTNHNVWIRNLTKFIAKYNKWKQHLKTWKFWILLFNPRFAIPTLNNQMRLDFHSHFQTISPLSNRPSKLRRRGVVIRTRFVTFWPNLSYNLHLNKSKDKKKLPKRGKPPNFVQEKKSSVWILPFPQKGSSRPINSTVKIQSLLLWKSVKGGIQMGEEFKKGFGVRFLLIDTVHWDLQKLDFISGFVSHNCHVPNPTTIILVWTWILKSTFK